MSPYVEIGHWRPLYPTTLLVSQEGFARQKARLVGQRLPREVDESGVGIFNPVEFRADLGENNGVDREGRVFGGEAERGLRPREPACVLGDDVEKDVRIDKRLQDLPRISAMISSVESLFDGRTPRR